MLVGELFDALARRGGITSASIMSKDDLSEFWEQITDQSFDSRLQTLLDMMDKTIIDRVTKEEVKEIIVLSASANYKLSRIQERAEEYAAMIMEELDQHNLGYIELNKLEMLLVQASAQSSTDSKMLSKELVSTNEHGPIKQSFRALADLLQNNWKRLWVLVMWLSICSTLFAWKFIQYKHHAAVFHVMGYCVSIAKGSAEMLKFNMALILLLVCRNTITLLRSKTKLGMVVPFDDNINFHKVIAFGIGVGVGLHAISYLTCNFPRLLQATNEAYEPLKPVFGNKRPNNYWLLIKGIEGWTGVTMMVLMAIPYILAQPWFRRNRLNLPKAFKKLTGFNAFWYSHHLYIIVYVLLLVHGYFLHLTYQKTTWMYLIIPMTLYSFERLLRAFRSGYKSARILKVAIYPEYVLALHISKPRRFEFSSGQYIYINCPDVSLFEWHPFSITSAPGDDYISIHIQTSGDWTSQLMAAFTEACQPTSSNQSSILQVDMLQGNNKPRIPRLLIDGPYGAPSQDYKNYEVLLLMGLGIGATPLISILKDMLNNIKQQDIEEGVLDSRLKNKKKPFAIKQAYFYWVTREKGSCEWFEGVMNDVADNDKEKVIELHNYCTCVCNENVDAQSSLLTMLQSIHHAKNCANIGSRTRVKTYFGRPNWFDIFKHITLKHPYRRVGVFYCGAHGLSRELSMLSLDFSKKTNTKFDFHKENF